MQKYKPTAYSAYDVARILVRNPDEILELPTYDRICDDFCRGRPLESLSDKEKDVVFSLELAVDDLVYLGFDREQIQTFLDAYQEAYTSAEIDKEIPERVYKTVKDRAYLTAFTIAAFPYGPPIVLREPYNVMAAQGFTLSQTRSSLNRLTSLTATKLMEKREENPNIFLIKRENQTQSAFSTPENI